MHEIYFILRLCLLSSAPGDAALPPRAHPVRPSTVIWLQALGILLKSVLLKILRAMIFFYLLRLIVTCSGFPLAT